MVTFKQKDVSKHEILRAIGDFDAQYADTNDYDSWLEKGIYKYAVQYDGELSLQRHFESGYRGSYLGVWRWRANKQSLLQTC